VTYASDRLERCQGHLDYCRRERERFERDMRHGDESDQRRLRKLVEAEQRAEADCAWALRSVTG
jgi:hypothetical protein